MEVPVPIHSHIDTYFKTRSLRIFLLVVTLVTIIVFKDFLSLKNVYLFNDIGNDSITTDYPHIVHVVDYLRMDGIPKWSFNQGMGQNLFGLLTFDPFLVVFYLVGRDGVSYAIAYVKVTQIVLAGLFFFLYLRTLPLSPYAAVVGGLLYSFTGYMILGSGWYIFDYDAMCVALLLYALEKLLKENVWYVLPIPIALIASSQPFHLYLYSVLLFVYAIVRCADANDSDVKCLATSLVRLIPLFLLGVGLSSMFFFSNVSQLFQSPRVEGGFSNFQTLSSQPVFEFATPRQYVSEILRLYSSDLMGTGNDFKGWLNYLESPLLYAGLINFLLVPQLFSFLDRRRRLFYGALLGLCLVPLIFPYFRYAFWLFTGNYFRALSFYISLVLLYLGIRALSHLDQGRRINLPMLTLSLLGALAFLYVPTRFYDQYAFINRDLRTVVTAFLILYFLLLAAMRSVRYAPIVKVGILIAVAVEAGYLSNITVNHRDIVSSKELSRRTGYNDYTNEAVAFIDSADKGFFRVLKDYSSIPGSINDGKVQRYKGTSSYSSFNQKYYIRFLEAVDVIQRGDQAETQWARGPHNRPLLETLISVKYNLTKRTDINAFGPAYDHLADFNDVHVYKNRYALPLGFCYNSYLTARSFSKLSPAQKDRAVLEAFFIEDDQREQFREFKSFDASSLGGEYSLESYENDVRAKRKDALSIRSYDQNHIRGFVTLDQKQLMFFSIPYDEGWLAKVDGKKQQPLLVDAGFFGLILEKGTHSVELEYKPPYLIAGSAVSLLSILVYMLLLFRSKHG
jgi:uncharacterized membrane protein YfhO